MYTDQIIESRSTPENLGYRQSKKLLDLPLLEFTASLYIGSSLQDVYILCAQHILPTTHELFLTMFEMGLDPKNIAVIGKCYSTNPETYRKMHLDQIDVSESSIGFEWNDRFDFQYKNFIDRFFKLRIPKITSKKIKKLIILDDGGELIALANEHLTSLCDVVGIEQTTSGFEKLRQLELKIPVVNVARSRAKLHCESPIIADVITERVLDLLKRFNLVSPNILIVGNGAIGQQMSSAVQKYAEVTIFDTCPDRSSVSPGQFKSILNRFDIIVGCTGQTSISHHLHPFLKKNAILVSASSSDREFDAVHLRRKVKEQVCCHGDIQVQNICLTNCGFPINFDRDYNTVDGIRFQLTRSLLLLQQCRLPIYRVVGDFIL